MSGHAGDELADVVTHKIELVAAVLVPRMNGDLRRRQPEDEPPFTDIDVRESEHVAQESSIRLGLLAVDDRVHTADHGSPLCFSCGTVH